MSERRAPQPSDLALLHWVESPQISPDGRWVAYVERRCASDQKDYETQLLLIAADGSGPPRQFSAGPKDSGPRWSPDGRRIAFVSNRDQEIPQVFVIDLDGGEARQLTHQLNGASDPHWSPDGEWLAYSSMVAVSAEAIREEERVLAAPDRAQARREAPLTRVARTLDWKADGLGYLGGRRNHLFVVPALGGEAIQVTRGDWAVGGFTWQPDNRGLVFSGTVEADADLRMEWFLYSIDLDGGEPERLTPPGEGASSPVISADGRDIIYLRYRDASRGGIYEDLARVALVGGEVSPLTSDLAVGDLVVGDLRAGHGEAPVVARDGRCYFQASVAGSTHLFRVGLDGSAPQLVLGGQRQVFAFSVADSGAVAFAATDPLEPGDLYVSEEGQERRLTWVNRELQETWHLARPRQLSLTAPDGLEMEGWLLLPEDGGPVPVVQEVHGGPHAAYGYSFFLEFQILAGSGIAVFYMNPRGSASYGEDFCGACTRDWVGQDYHDLMAGLDQALGSESRLDSTRQGIAGGSYGGLMTNWAIGQTDRFGAAVTMRSLVNMVSEYGTGDIVLWSEIEVGDPRSNFDEMWRRSPLANVERIHTPLLILHGEMDLRCSVQQAEELFSSLRRLGRPVEMVRFPGESHDMSRSGRPDRRIERLRLIREWFARHLGEASGASQIEAAAGLRS